MRGGGSLHWEFGEVVERALGTEHLSLWALCERNLERWGDGSFTENPEVCVEEGSGDEQPSTRAQLGNLEEGSCTGEHLTKMYVYTAI
jgi:hypothetical protein